MHLSTFVEKQKDGPDGQALHFTAEPLEWLADSMLQSSLVIRPREEQVGDTPGDFAKAIEARAGIAQVLELDQPMTRYAVCRAAGWNRGPGAYRTIEQAVPEDGVRVSHPVHGAVILTRKGDKITMTVV
ncbi:hypothetical protein ACFQU2_00420 [Siccirubricoccus deserti]